MTLASCVTLPALEGPFVEAEFHAGATGGRPSLFADVGRHLEGRHHLVCPGPVGAQLAGLGQADPLCVDRVDWELRFCQRLCRNKKRKKENKSK